VVVQARRKRGRLGLALGKEKKKISNKKTETQNREGDKVNYPTGVCKGFLVKGGALYRKKGTRFPKS